jgi:hypothetical protein
MLQGQKDKPVLAKADHFGHYTPAVAEMDAAKLTQAQSRAVRFNRQTRHSHDGALAV